MTQRMQKVKRWNYSRPIIDRTLKFSSTATKRCDKINWINISHSLRTVGGKYIQIFFLHPSSLYLRECWFVVVGIQDGNRHGSQDLCRLLIGRKRGNTYDITVQRLTVQFPFRKIDSTYNFMNIIYMSIQIKTILYQYKYFFILVNDFLRNFYN